jgi:pimeloyl-ACP methyl ester carboxylesterase
MPTVTTDDGVALSYATAGNGPPDLLFMHGWAGSGRYFDATIEHLDLTQLRAVTYDLRGHRESDPARDGYTLERIAADALAVADAAGFSQFVVVGFSMSAKFGQYLAVLAPDRVAGLILVAGCPTGEIPLPKEMTDDWFSREGDPVRMAQLPEAYMTRPVELEVMERFGTDAATAGRAALEGTLTAATATSFTDQLAAITTPSLVIGGSGDPMFPPDALRAAVVAPLPEARLELVDCGHDGPDRGTERARCTNRSLRRGVGLRMTSETVTDWALLAREHRRDHVDELLPD